MAVRRRLTAGLARGRRRLRHALRPAPSGLRPAVGAAAAGFATTALVLLGREDVYTEAIPMETALVRFVPETDVAALFGPGLETPARGALVGRWSS